MAKILIAEDERPISELVKRNLMLVGHTAAQAFDGPCALEMAGAERFDLVLLDVMLPGCSGFEVKEQLDRRCPSFSLRRRTTFPAVCRGWVPILGRPDDYIVKPFEILELLARVEAVLRRVHAGAEVFDLATAMWSSARTVCSLPGARWRLRRRNLCCWAFWCATGIWRFPGKAAAIGLGLRL